MHPWAKSLKEQESASEKEYQASSFGGFGDYFRNKQIKLQTQDVLANNQLSDIFKDCFIYINGYTQPSAATLKRLILENGGRICAFYGGKSYATHIIAESLTLRKNELFGNCKVVKPQWVLDSIEQGKLLNWTKYNAIPVPQRKLDFFSEESSVKVDSVPAQASQISLGSQFSFSSQESACEPEQPQQEPQLENLDNNESEPAETNLAPSSPFEEPQGPSQEWTDEQKTDWINHERRRVNCMDPNFIKNYYARSRLHFLSVSKARLKRMCQGIPRRNCAAREKVVIHVDFDSFFVAVALKKRPDLNEKPVCVSHGSDSSDVASCNYVARAMGVRNGMWVGSARRVCPDLLCLDYDFEEYERCSNALYKVLKDLDPDCLAPISVDEAMVDVTSRFQQTNIEELKGSVLEFCESIRHIIFKLTGIQASAGAGANVLLAKMALSLAKPAGSYHIRSSDAEECLANQSVAKLPGVGRHISAKLAALDVEKVQDLRSIPVGKLETLLGSAVAQRLHRASLGLDTDDIMTLVPETRTIGVELGWGIRLLDHNEVEVFVGRLTEELWQRTLATTTKPDIVTVKASYRAPEASFISAKVMGMGECETMSRQRSLDPNKVDLPLLKKLVMEVLRTFEIPPLDLRAVGLHLRLVTEPEYKGQTRITGQWSNTRPKSSERPNSSSGLPPPRVRRRRGPSTLTQMLHRPEAVDPEVFDLLPSQLQREIMSNEQDFNVWIPPRPPVTLFLQQEYIPFKLMGMSDGVELRSKISQWIETSPQPFYEDAVEVRDYLLALLSEDWDWMKGLNLYRWIEYQVNKTPRDDAWTLFLKEIQRVVGEARRV